MQEIEQARTHANTEDRDGSACHTNSRVDKPSGQQWEVTGQIPLESGPSEMEKSPDLEGTANVVSHDDDRRIPDGHMVSIRATDSARGFGEAHSRVS